MRSAAVLALTAGLASPCSDAADWLKFTEIAPSGSYVEIDSASIAQAPYERKKAWFRWTYSKPQRIGEAIPKAEPQVTVYSSSVTLVHFNCAEHTQATMQSILYGPNGNVVGSYTLSSWQATWSEFAPDTIGEMMHNLVCKLPEGFKLDAPASKN